MPFELPNSIVMKTFENIQRRSKITRSVMPAATLRMGAVFGVSRVLSAVGGTFPGAVAAKRHGDPDALRLDVIDGV